MKIVELSPVCGVEVQGVDLCDDLSPTDVLEMREAFLHSHLLLFREQGDDEVAHARFLSHLGALEQSADGSRSVVDYVSTERADNVARAGRLLFHVDRSFRAAIPYAFSMYALKMSTDAGPPTAFANAEYAYLRLPEGLKAKLEGLSIVNLVDFDSFQGQDTIRTRRLDIDDVDQERFVHATHPAVVRLPITNRPVLLVNEHQTSHFVGMDPDESENLYLELLEYLYSSDNVLWHDWEVGDFVVWNNLAIHHGRPTAPVGTRELRRMIVSTAA